MKSWRNTFTLVVLLLGFISNSNGQTPKYKLNNLRPLTAEGTYFGDFYWSPDSKTIAMLGGKPRGLYVVKADSPQSLRRVADKIRGSCLAWSPDGKEVAFMQYVGDTVITGKKAVSEKVKSISPYMPDSQPVAWKVKSEAIKVVNVETGNMREITRGAQKFGSFEWTNDGILRLGEAGLETRTQYYDKNGKKITAKTTPKVRLRKDSHLNLYFINDDGTNRRQITTDGGYAFAGLSPDGKKILVHGECFMVIDVETNKIEKLGVSGDGGWWSPDEKSIVFEGTKYGGHDGGALVSSDIYIMDSNGDNLTRLTFAPEKIYLEPTFSPDGRKILLTATKEKRVYIAELGVNEK